MNGKKTQKPIPNKTAKQDEVDLLRQGLASVEMRERKLRWTVIALFIVVALFLILGGLGWVNNSRARSEAATAQSNFYHVAIKLVTADAKGLEAQNQAQTARALQLASQSQKIFSTLDGEQETAVLLAIQSMRMVPSGEAAQVLQDSTLAYPISQMKHSGYLTSAAFSPNGKYVVLGGGESASVWEAETGKEIANMMHGHQVYSVAFSPNGLYVVSGGCDRQEGYSCSHGSARIWDAFTGHEIARIESDSLVGFVTFSPDGEYILSCGKPYNSWHQCEDSFAQVWDAFNGEEIARIKHNYYVTSVAFSFDGKYIVSGGCDDQTRDGYCKESLVRVWDISSGKEIISMKQSGIVTSVAFSPNGRRIVSASTDDTARVWDIASGEEIYRIKHDKYMASVAFSADDKYLVLIDWNSVRLFDAYTARETSHIVPYDGVSLAYFSSDGQYLITAGSKTARVWDAATGKEITRMELGNVVTSIAISPDNKYVVSGSSDGNFHVLQATNQENVRKIHHDKYVTSLDFSSDGRYVASSDEDGIVRVWNISTGNEFFNTETRGSHIDAIDMTLDGRYLAFVIRNRAYDWELWVTTISVWEIATGQEITHLVDDSSAAPIAFSPDAKYIASGGYDYVIQVWDASTGKELIKLPFDNEYISSIAFSSNGRYLVSTGQLSVRVFEISTGNEIARMIHDDIVSSAAFSPDGKYIVSGGGYSARIWEVFTGKEIARLTPTDGISSISFSPDGKYIVSGGEKTVRIWEFLAGQEIARMTHHNVRSVAFTSDGRYVSSGSYMGDVRVWKWRSEDLIADACSRVTRNLTRIEWQQYIGATLPYQAVCPEMPIELEPDPILITSPTLIPIATFTPTIMPSPLRTPTFTITP